MLFDTRLDFINCIDALFYKNQFFLAEPQLFLYLDPFGTNFQH